MSTTEAPAKPEAKFVYPELPKAKDPAANFYCVFLQGHQGPTAAIPTFVEEAPVENVERPWEDLGFTIPSNRAEMHRMEERKPRLRRKENGADAIERARRWQNAFEKTERYYEDPAHAAKGIRPRVIGVTMYCPLNEPIGPNGTLEDHGPYAPVGAESAHGIPMASEPGTCPKCRTEGQRANALREIAQRYQWANVPLPAPLAAKIGALLGRH